MSGTMVRQGGRVQLEQSDMCLSLNMARMAKDGFLRAAIEAKTYLIQTPPAKVRVEKKRGVECPGHEKVKAAIQRHPAMLRQNQTSSCHPCQMALKIIRRHAGGAKEQVHLHPPNAESGFQSRLRIRPGHRPPRLVTLPEHNLLKLSICLRDRHIRIQLFPVWNFSKMMSIPSLIPILIQIC